MRIDKFLKNSRIIKRRTVAKEACDGGRVSINNKVAKSGDTVKVGDIIEVRFGTGELKVVVKEIIDNPKKNQAAEMIEKVE
ncbi:MAG: RNA-binding S4 domain-containing protein [Miniphocaeibacter sp.]|uniref:RNA-binding S4 domain-containing protein n=1 Tax=Miniphocaeibacter sp. TaxID=3100973 RepID=UPI0017D72C1A|nr:RNA-binding S4 domain-containing protein [Gallicola sp.]